MLGYAGRLQRVVNAAAVGRTRARTARKLSQATGLTRLVSRMHTGEWEASARPEAGVLCGCALQNRGILGIGRPEG
jgi:hypothetical protein